MIETLIAGLTAAALLAGPTAARGFGGGSSRDLPDIPAFSRIRVSFLIPAPFRRRASFLGDRFLLVGRFSPAAVLSIDLASSVESLSPRRWQRFPIRSMAITRIRTPII